MVVIESLRERAACLHLSNFCLDVRTGDEVVALSENDGDLGEERGP